MSDFLLHDLPKGINPGLFGAIAALVSGGAIYGPLLVLLFAMRKVARGGSYECRSGRAHKVYSPPPGFAFGAVSFVLCYPVLLAAWNGFLLAPVFQRWTAPGHPSMARDLLLVAGTVGLACWGAIRWLRCYALTLNLQERTYRSVPSSGFSLRAENGSWQDIAGIHIYTSNRRRPEESFAYFVGLKLYGGRKVYSVLGGFRRREQAEAYAAKAARELGLPLISDTVQQVERGRSGRSLL